MTVLLECKNISIEYGDFKVLDNINLKIKEGEKLAIVGNNGGGKTTLANIIYGSIKAEGSVKWFKKNTRIGYMKQATDYVKGYDALSGGEKTKKLLTEVLYGNYDMLILDEPTNHLDYLGVEWLVKSIKKFKGTVLIISHDRYFLDKCVNRIIEIEDKKITEYNGNYSFYREKKNKDYEDALHEYKNQEAKKAAINKQIDELKRWSQKAHRDSTKKAKTAGCKMGVKEFYRAKAKKKDIQVKSKIKKLEKLNTEGIDKPKEEDKIIFKIREAEKTGSVVLRAENISKSYDNKVIFNKSSFYIKRNEKIGLYGVNGCGKTTLVKAILGELNIDGSLYINKDSRIGYISQEVIGLDEEKSIIDIFPKEDRKSLGDIITKLDLLGFKKDTLNRKIKVLSLGEKMKLKILSMIEEDCDILILDEPTNHIDLHVREQLESVLVNYTGTILLVTHDRYMLEKVCDKLLVFKDNTISRWEYGINEYLDKINNTKKEKSEEQLIILNNKISCVLSELSMCQIGSERYMELDKEYKELILEKRSLLSYYNK